MASSNLIHLEPKAAWAYLQTNPQALLIDVRSEMEFLFVGHPLGAIHIAWIDEPDWEINPDFMQDITQTVQKHLKTEEANLVKQHPLLLICRSGVRSVEAGNVLCEAGFTAVHNITEGFEGKLNEQQQRGFINGWRWHKLPWQQC